MLQLIEQFLSSLFTWPGDTLEDFVLTELEVRSDLEFGQI